jgi:putative ABC transport system permease protein
VGIDLRVLGFALLVSALTAVAFGLAPALQASGVDLSGGLKEGAKASAGARRNRFRSALVVAEVALSLVLLVGAGLMIKSFVRLSEVELGFRAQNVIATDLSLPYRYNTGASRKEFFQRLLERVETLPGVKAASVSQSVPLSGEEHGAAFTIVGRQVAEGEGKFGGIFHRVSADYLRVMGVPLLRGRALTENDTAEAPAVALVNDVLARRFFPGEDPVGKQILLDGSPRPREIVGVVGNVRYVAPHIEPVSEIYISYLDAPYHHMSLAVRADGDPRRLVADIKAVVSEMDRDIPLANLKTMEEYVAGSRGGQRFGMTLIAAFAGAALLLAAVGVYGVMSGAVAQRTHEIGVRLALGARPRDILKLVVGKGAALMLAGVAVGLGGALALTRVMSSLLYEVSPTDPATYAAVSLLIAGVSLLACYVPARRAVRVDPTEALRAE